MSEGQKPKTKLMNLPNQLTIARLILSVVWFVVLALFTHGTFPAEWQRTVLNLSTLFFILAVGTDFLDGYLARKWNLESTFGRIADPFVDKILICGGFIMLTGISGLVKPWFPLLIVFREFLISGLRSYLESKGVAFGASLSGKLKMIFQSIAIPGVLLYEANFHKIGGGEPESVFADFATPFYWLTIALLAITLFLTFASCVGYIGRATKLLKEDDGEA